MKSVPVVLLREGLSANGFSYQRADMQRAVDAGLFRNLPSYLDHEGPPGSPARIRAGTIKNARMGMIDGAAAVVGELRVNERSKRTVGVLETAAQCKRLTGKDYVGLSIDARATLRESKGLRLPEITSVRSVDIVCDASAGGSILPSDGREFVLRESVGSGFRFTREAKAADTHPDPDEDEDEPDDDEAALTELTTLYRKQEDHIKRLEAIVERYERMHKNADGISESAAPIRAADPLRETERVRKIDGASISFDDEPHITSYLRKAI